MSTRRPLAPREIQDLKISKPLDAEQEEKRSKILEHFSGGDYEIPGLDEGAKLTELDKFWLVRSNLHGRCIC